MSVGLTRTDLSDAENLRDARAELVRARDASSETLRILKLADWAKKWGEAAIAELENPSNNEDDDRDDFQGQLEAEQEVNQLLTLAVETALDEILAWRDVHKLPADTDDELGDILKRLEKATSL